MNKVQAVGTQDKGILGYLREVEIKPETVLVFQLPYDTNDLTNELKNNALEALKSVLPDGYKALVIANDVNIYEIPGMDAAVLLLKGIG